MTAPTGPAGPAPDRPRLIPHLSALAKLAWPVMLSRAGILLMAFCDVAMLGRYEAGAVGILNLGLAVFIPTMVVSIGLCTGLVPVVSMAYGRGDWAECGRAWRRALVWGSVISIFAIWIVLQAGWVLRAMGQTPELAAAGSDVAAALAPGLWAQVLFAVSAFYLESTHRPRTALWVMIGANVINFGLNALLIFGLWGFPEWGAVGAALASTVARFAAAGVMIAVILTQARPYAAGVLGPWDTFWGPGGWRAGWPMRKLGLSAGISNGFETVGFAALMLFAGQVSLAALDAYSIAHNLVSVLFMVGLGLSVATGVRVGNEIGRGRPAEAAFAGWTGVGATIAVMGLLAVIVLALPDEIAAIYTDDPALQAQTAALLLVSAFIFVPDATQVVLGQAVRALGDAWIPITVYALSFFVVMIPLGWAAVTVLGGDERDLALSVVIACTLATVLLAWRFRVLTLRPEGRE